MEEARAWPRCRLPIGSRFSCRLRRTWRCSGQFSVRCARSCSVADVPLALRDFTFRAMLFDAECERFRAAGLRVGIPSEAVDIDLMREALSPFGLSLRDPALRMARLYATLNCFENSVRELVSSRLLEYDGANWWDQRVPGEVKKRAEA